MRLAGVAEAGVAQRQAPQCVPAGDGRDEMSLLWRVCRVVGRNVRYAGFEQVLGLLVQARAIPPPTAHTEREGGTPGAVLSGYSGCP